MILKLQNDKYRLARGGYSRFLDLRCSRCKSLVSVYQKDGPGVLKRLYIDRMLNKEAFRNGKEFICKNCKKVIGTFYIYEKENRPAIRLYQDAIFKKLKKRLS